MGLRDDSISQGEWGLGKTGPSSQELSQDTKLEIAKFQKLSNCSILLQLNILESLQKWQVTVSSIHLYGNPDSEKQSWNLCERILFVSPAQFLLDQFTNFGLRTLISLIEEDVILRLRAMDLGKCQMPPSWYYRDVQVCLSLYRVCDDMRGKNFMN